MADIWLLSGYFVMRAMSPRGTLRGASWLCVLYAGCPPGRRRGADRLFILNIFRVRKTPCAVLSTQLNHPKCGLAAESKRGEEPLMFSIFFPFPRRLALPWPDVVGIEFSTESAKKAPHKVKHTFCRIINTKIRRWL